MWTDAIVLLKPDHQEIKKLLGRRSRVLRGRKALQEMGTQMQHPREKAPRKPSQPSDLKEPVDAIIA